MNWIDDDGTCKGCNLEKHNYDHIYCKQCTRHPEVRDHKIMMTVLEEEE